MSPPVDIATARTADDIAREVEALYGSPLTEPAGVLHVTSVWEQLLDTRVELVTLKIDQRAPPSRHDFFVLNLCRARADAIVVSGKILRDEPEVRHTLQGAGQLPGALAAWRREHLGKDTPPTSLVLSSGRGLDLDHPLFADAHRPIVYTSPEGRDRLASEAAARGIRLVADAQANLRRAVDFLRTEGAGTVSIECGPRTSRQLYEPPVVVDELLLSVFEGHLAERSRGTVLATREELESALRIQGPGIRRDSESGSWRFERYRR